MENLFKFDNRSSSSNSNHLNRSNNQHMLKMESRSSQRLSALKPAGQDQSLHTGKQRAALSPQMTQSAARKIPKPVSLPSVHSQSIFGCLEEDEADLISEIGMRWSPLSVSIMRATRRRLSSTSHSLLTTPHITALHSMDVSPKVIPNP